jgi:hypothetical protein
MGTIAKGVSLVSHAGILSIFPCGSNRTPVIHSRRCCSWHRRQLRAEGGGAHGRACPLFAARPMARRLGRSWGEASRRSAMRRSKLASTRAVRWVRGDKTPRRDDARRGSGLCYSILSWHISRAPGAFK